MTHLELCKNVKGISSFHNALLKPHAPPQPKQHANTRSRFPLTLPSLGLSLPVFMYHIPPITNTWYQRALKWCWTWCGMHAKTLGAGMACEAATGPRLCIPQSYFSQDYNLYLRTVYFYERHPVFFVGDIFLHIILSPVVRPKNTECRVMFNVVNMCFINLICPVKLEKLGRWTV